MSKDHRNTHEIAEYMIAHTDGGREQHERCIVCELYTVTKNVGLATKVVQEANKITQKNGY